MEIKKFLLDRGAVGPLEDIEIDGLCADTTPVAAWIEDEDSPYGYDFVALTRARHYQKAVWILTKSWWPAPGYCADGTSEEIISYRDGITMALEHGITIS